MLAASMDNDSFDEEEGDTVYKVRYDRSGREAEMTKQQLKREHTDDLEQAESAKKHLERKVCHLEIFVILRRQLTWFDHSLLNQYGMQMTRGGSQQTSSAKWHGFSKTLLTPNDTWRKPLHEMPTWRRSSASE
jgi:hypothetical protein